MSSISNPHVILIADHLEPGGRCHDDPGPVFLAKSTGTQKIAHELRLAGYTVAIINHVHIYDFSELCHVLRHLVSERTLFIGVSPGNYLKISREDSIRLRWDAKEFGAMLPHGREYNVKLKAFVHACNPRVKWVVGGPDAMDLPYNRDYDYVVEGMADRSVINLARHLESGEPLHKSYRSINGFVMIRDILAEGFDFANSTMTWESQDVIFPDETLSTEVSRGCRFKCTFCAYPLNGRKKNDYIKNEDILYQELMTNYERFGTTQYNFVDDTFNESDEKVDMVWRIKQRLPFELKYRAYIRLDLLAARKHHIDRLFESGCRAAFMGIETFNPQAGSAIGKSGRREQLIETLEYIRSRYGRSISIHAAFIAGLPHESLDSLLETRDWLLQTDILDSFRMRALRIRRPDSFLPGEESFVSDIDANPGKFGYTLLNPIDEQMINWRNEHMDYATAWQISEELSDQTLHRQGVEGLRLFYMSSLGYPLDRLIGCKTEEIPWNQLKFLKHRRIREIKKRFFDFYHIPPR